MQLTLGHARLLQAVPGKQKPALVLRSDVANVYGNPLDEHLFSHHILNATRKPLVWMQGNRANLMQLPGRPEIREANIRSISAALRAEVTKYAMPLMIEPLACRTMPPREAGTWLMGTPTRS